jgi:hypothetical protein
LWDGQAVCHPSFFPFARPRVVVESRGGGPPALSACSRQRATLARAAASLSKAWLKQRSTSPSSASVVCVMASSAAAWISFL